MEKTPMYAVVTPSRPQKSGRVLWLALGVSVVGLIVAAVTGYVEKRQIDRMNALEETVLQMQLHMEQMLQFTHEYLEYEEDDIVDPQGRVYEELTVRGVARKKRQATDDGGVPIYDQAYGVNLNNRFNSEGLRLYKSFADGEDPDDDARSGQVSFESTESPIKPHHRVSNLWVPKKRRQQDPPAASGPELLFSRAPATTDEDDAEEILSNYADDDQVYRSRQRPRHSPVTQRRSRVKATARSDSLNNVVPQTPSIFQAPTVVEQRPQKLKQRMADALVSPYIKKDSKKKRPRKKQARRGGKRRARLPAITLGHFVAAPLNRTAHHYSDGEVHDEWAPAAWMDKLGLNRKYTLRRGEVTVKESGLYYLYAQVLYEQGRFGTGFQLMVDGISVMECSMTPSQPSHSCHTSGTTYLQRNAAVYIRDRESHMTTVRREANSFFGLIKLMDAPESAEKLILG